MNNRVILHLLHILILGPFLLYVGLGYPIPPWVLTAVGIIVILYQGYKAYVHYSQQEAVWVNLFHVIIVGPALLAYGITEERWTRELIFMLGFAAIGYHGYYMVQSI
jgi:hypothetical protein